MKQKIFELLDKNFKRENIGTCNYWILDGRIVASDCECSSAIDVYFDNNYAILKSNYYKYNKNTGTVHGVLLEIALSYLDGTSF